MPATMIELDESAGATENRYHYTRVVQIAGRTVRTRIQRDYYVRQSFAVVEVLANDMTWTHLADDAPGNWHATTPTPNPTVHAATELSELADQLAHRAAEILAPPPNTPSPHVLNTVSALLATTYGYDGERRITPDEVEWANTHGGGFHVIEHGDGSVTFTKAHRDECPFLTSAGTQDCDDECYFAYPADVERRLGK
jgi:hypothetical protein